MSPAGDWDMKGPGVTAIAHPASLETATTHGVFVLEGVKEIAERYATSEGGGKGVRGREGGREG